MFGERLLCAGTIPEESLYLRLIDTSSIMIVIVLFEHICQYAKGPKVENQSQG